jgi:hypothetical protein
MAMRTEEELPAFTAIQRPGQCELQESAERKHIEGVAALRRAKQKSAQTVGNTSSLTQCASQPNIDA